jgi:hypothetical protein
MKALLFDFPKMCLRPFLRFLICDLSKVSSWYRYWLYCQLLLISILFWIEPEFTPGRVTWSLVLCIMFCKSLFVLLSYFFWVLCCLSFLDLRIQSRLCSAIWTQLIWTTLSIAHSRIWEFHGINVYKWYLTTFLLIYQSFT